MEPSSACSWGIPVPHSCWEISHSAFPFCIALQGSEDSLWESHVLMDKLVLGQLPCVCLVVTTEHQPSPGTAVPFYQHIYCIYQHMYCIYQHIYCIYQHIYCSYQHIYCTYLVVAVPWGCSWPGEGAVLSVGIMSIPENTSRSSTPHSRLSKRSPAASGDTKSDPQRPGRSPWV